MKNRSGQILTLVLLIVVVALAVGLSVASRNITNLRTSTQTEQSQRAFSAAEGGVEDVLSRLGTVQAGIPVGGQITETLTVGGIPTEVTIKKGAVYEQTIELGNVGQIDLAGPPSAAGILNIEWAKCGDNSETDQPASLEVTLVSESAGVVNQTRKYYQGFARSDETGVFDASNSPGCSLSTYAKSAILDLTGITGPKILRTRPFWVKTTVKVSGSLPAQTYDITSTATTDIGVTRRVQVSRSALPQLPAVFDYALFSEGDITK